MKNHDSGRRRLPPGLTGYRDAAHAEADAHFDERALDTQRRRILDRLAHLGESARVIRFPRTAYGARPSARANQKWVSAAAAAGLVVGLFGGRAFHGPFVPFSPPADVPAAIADTEPGAAPPGGWDEVLLGWDDAFLGEVDLAVELRSTAELRALDELTPFLEPR